MLKGNSLSVAPVPASPLPAIEDVAEEIICFTDCDRGKATEAFQAIQSLYREHFAGWLESDGG